MNKVMFAISTAALITLVSTPITAGDKGPPGKGDRPPDQFMDLVNTLEPKTVFVTSVRFTGDLVSEANALLGTSFTDDEGLEAGDALCQHVSELPDSIVPVDEYVALLSTDDVNGSSRITPSIAPYIRPDGTILAADAANVFVVNNIGLNILFAAPELDETGAVAEIFDVWTGTGTDGLAALAVTGDYDCQGWTSSDSSHLAAVGEQDERDTQWIFKAADPCGASKSLYCVQR